MTTGVLNQAAWLRERAAELETIATHLPVLPSRREYDAANDAANRDWCKDNMPPDDEMLWRATNSTVIGSSN